MSNLIDFITSGLERNEYSIIIENERVTQMIKQRLKELLNESYLETVAFVNNYDFYYAKGDFRINSVFNYLPRLTKGFSELDSVVRSWAHIEWRDEHNVNKGLLNSENEADTIVAETNLLSVCAYDSERVSEDFREGLLRCHNFLISEKIS